MRGLLVMAYGTPSGPEAIEPYYTHIRHGRPPTPELLAELQDRYAAIGGVSPLLELTRAQVDGLRDALAARGHDDLVVALGMKHAPPFIEDAAAALRRAGVTEVVGLVLAPHYAAMSVGQYGDRAAAALGPDVRFDLVASWGTAPGYVDLLAAYLADAVAAVGGDAHVLITAHSLPERILQAGDPYPDELRATAQAVAARAGLARWSIAWQSAGRTADPWIGPDVLEELTRLAHRGERAVVVCPAGFVADHLEVLYDLDIEAAAHAARLGIAFARTAAPNADPRFVAALADVVEPRLPAPAATGART